MNETKRCTKCGGVKIEAEFSRLKNGRLNAQCKACSAKEARDYWAKRSVEQVAAAKARRKAYAIVNKAMLDVARKHWQEMNRDRIYKTRKESSAKRLAQLSPPIHKTCKACERTVPISKFNRHPLTGDGFFSTCKECDSIRRKAWYQANRDEVLRRSHEWSRKNVDLIKLKGGQYYQANLERCREWRRRYARDHAAEGRQRNKRYRDLLADSYVRATLVNEGFPRQSISRDLIEAKHFMLAIRRETTRKVK